MKQKTLTLAALTAFSLAAMAEGGASPETVKRLQETDPHGFGITILCMGVVFLCLALLYVFFSIFGYFADRPARLKKVADTQPIKPIVKTVQKVEEVRHVTKNILQDGIETKGRDKELYIAVIAMALKQYLDDVHDVESGVLTIKPHHTEWNSAASVMME